MAIETQAYYYLLDPFVQFENNAGKPIVAGHVEVFKAGTDEKVITLQDFDGTENPFKIPLGSDGRATILVDIGYTYDCYVYDSFNNLACSRLNIIPLANGDITVTGLTKVYHDETLKGKGTATDPLSVADGAQATVSVSAPLTGNGAPESPVGLDTDKFIIKDSNGNATMYDSKGNQVALTVNNTTNENEAHIHVESNYEDGSYWWAEIDGARGGIIQQNWYDTTGTSAHDHLSITRSDIAWGVFDEDNNFTVTYSVKDEIGNKTSKSDFYFDENGVCQSVYGKPFAASWANEADKAYKDGNGNDIASTYTKKSDFDTWTDEGHTYVTGLDGNAFNAHWSNYATHDEKGNVINESYAGKSDFVFDKDNHLYTVSGKEIWAAGANYATNANWASSAETATSSTFAYKSDRDDLGRIISNTYQTKLTDYRPATWNAVTAKANISDFGFNSFDKCDTISGRQIDANWANYAKHDENGNVIADTYQTKLTDYNPSLWNTVSDKLDTNTFSTVSGDFALKSEIPSLDGYLKGSDLSIDGTLCSAISGYGLSATMAERDSQGNILTATYAQKSEIPSIDTCVKYSDLADDGFGNVAGIGTSGLVATWASKAGESNAVRNTVTTSTDILSYSTDYNDKHQHFGISNYEGGIEVRMSNLDADTEGWYWSNDYFGYRDQGTNWAPYMSLDKYDLRFSDNHDDSYISFKDLYSTVSSNSGNWDQVGDKLDTTAFSNVSGTFLTAHQSLNGYAKTADLTAYYPITGGNLKGSIAASGAGSTSNQQTGVVYAKITNTTKNNQAGLGTNGSVFAGDYGSTTSQTIGVRRKISDTSAMAGRFQLYSDGNVSFQQVSNNGTADSIVCQLQYGQTTTGFNWGTMTSGTTVKHIAYTEDIPSVPVIGTIEV